MEKSKVFDLPTRLLHWLFAGLFIAAFTIAKTTDDESPLFSQHMLLGLLLTLTATLRFFWGIFGSRYAKFSSFPLKPSQLGIYFKDILSTKGKQYFSHNPASAWAALLMIILSFGLGITGILMATGQKESLEDLHELLANAFAFVAFGHVTGVILHSIRHRDGIGFSMIHGKKDVTQSAQPITNSHPLIAMIMAGIIGVFAFHIYGNYDSKNGTTSVFGISLQLGENETNENESEKNDEHKSGSKENQENSNNNDSDDDD